MENDNTIELFDKFEQERNNDLKRLSLDNKSEQNSDSQNNNQIIESRQLNGSELQELQSIKTLQITLNDQKNRKSDL